MKVSLPISNTYLHTITLSLLLTGCVFFAAGCSDPTPEQKLAIAEQKVYEQRPPDLPGASKLLKEIAEGEEVDPIIRMESYLLLAEVYKSIGDLERAKQFLGEAVDFFGVDTEEGQQVQTALVTTLMQANETDAAHEAIKAMLAREDLPGPRRTWYRLREAEILDRKEEFDEAAEKFFQLALEFEDQQVETIALERYIQIKAREGEEVAANAYLRFVEEKPDSPTVPMARFGAGVFLMQAGKEAEAVALMDEFIVATEEELEAEELSAEERVTKSISLARAYTLAKKNDKEREIYNQIISDNRENQRLVAQLIQAVVNSHMMEENMDGAFDALENYERDFAGTPIADMAGNLTAQLLKFQKEFEAQMAAAEAALASEGEASEVEAPEEPSEATEVPAKAAAEQSAPTQQAEEEAAEPGDATEEEVAPAEAP